MKANALHLCFPWDQIYKCIVSLPPMISKAPNDPRAIAVLFRGVGWGTPPRHGAGPRRCPYKDAKPQDSPWYRKIILRIPTPNHSKHLRSQLLLQKHDRSRFV